MTSTAFKIIEHFDKAAAAYNQQASLQAQVATKLVDWAAPHLHAPQTILDIGTGTGFVAEALQKQWPQAQLTATDSAPRMLRQAEKRVPHLRTIRGDASTIEFTQKFDAIFSSMMLHWLDDPLDILKRWQNWLKPEGSLFAALLVEGSFQEWRTLCSDHNVEDGLWPMPPMDFAGEDLPLTKREAITITYPTAHDFLHRLKTTGAATPRDDHKPMPIATMRHLLRAALQPFPVTYQILYIGKSLQGNV